MSWLYSIVFAGLMFSSQGDPLLGLEPRAQSTPVPMAKPAVMEQRETFEQTYSLNAKGRVMVSNVDGSITIQGWDRNEVKLEYTKVADTKERLAEIEVRVDARPDRFTVVTDYGDWKKDPAGNRWQNQNGNLNVEYRLMVPRTAVLNQVETVNGSVSVYNFSNVTNVSTVNGSVIASRVRGTAKLSTVNGEVNADFDPLETGMAITLDSVNGRVNLQIPSDANATVKADSLNGNITNDFGLPVRKGKYVGCDLFGRLGSGDVQIKLNSVNGGLSIRRKNDGKSLSPAVNMLPQKTEDDEDWDGGEDVAFKSARLKKEVSKAIKDRAQVAHRKAIADAHVKLPNVPVHIKEVGPPPSIAAANAFRDGTMPVLPDELKIKMKDFQMAQQAMGPKIIDAIIFRQLPQITRKIRTFSVKGIPTVTIDAKACSVAVKGWDRSEVEYRATQFSDPIRRTPLRVTEENTETAVAVRIENGRAPVSDGQPYSDLNRVRVEVFVPVKSNLKIMAGGEIRVDGVSGDVNLVGGQESINVRDADGLLHVANEDGRIRVIGFRGEVDATTQEGMISLEGDFKKLVAKTDSGSVWLTLPDNASADLLSNCSQIRGEGIALTKVGGNEDLSKYRIGNGGAKFRIDTQGQIRIRSSRSLKDEM
ncbi:MAG: DUF4097 family beta strand repeat-containing protein [Pyrinomonadaceae bacterium]